MSSLAGDTILKWILVIVIIVILYVSFIHPYFDNVNKVKEEQEKCAFDIKASAKTSFLSKGDKALAIDCPTQKITLGDELSDEEIKQKIAQGMVECHELWGSGRLLLFDKEGTYCHKCSVIDFEVKSGQSVTGFNQFLVSAPGANTYASQLRMHQQSETIGDDLPESVADLFVIDRDKTYSTMFVYMRGKKAIDNFLAVIEADDFEQGVGVIGVGTTGAVTACLIFGGGLVCAASFTGFGLIAAANFMKDFFQSTPPEFASAVVLREFTAENVAQLGCNMSFSNS